METRKIKGFSDWNETVKQVYPIRRTNGEVVEFEIYGINAKTFAEIRKVYSSLIPPAPQPPRGKDGEPMPNVPKYREELQEYEAAKTRAGLVMYALIIDEGWAKPNGSEIPGKTPEEKADALMAKMDGEVGKLAGAIVDLSGLREEHISFF